MYHVKTAQDKRDLLLSLTRPENRGIEYGGPEQPTIDKIEKLEQELIKIEDLRVSNHLRYIRVVRRFRRPKP